MHSSPCLLAQGLTRRAWTSLQKPFDASGKTVTKCDYSEINRRTCPRLRRGEPRQRGCDLTCPGHSGELWAPPEPRPRPAIGFGPLRASVEGVIPGEARCAPQSWPC
jgi:hypothetical protein